ncbi:hypothetical protein ACR71G_01930 [Xenorhabdus bovienii]|uniref:hypothetical protein n=1 Tax=Xenorhabdus bovienii TaxID=40576 RepID=UPI003DA48D06
MDRIRLINQILQPETIIFLRQRMGLFQEELGRIMGMTLRPWQRKEACSKELKQQYDSSTLTLGESNFLLLIADKHPNYRLTTQFKESRVISEQPTAENVRQLRGALGLTPQEMATQMGYTVSAWRSKEQASKRGIKLKQGEYNLLLVLAGMHSKMEVTTKLKEDPPELLQQQKGVIQAELGQIMSFTPSELAQIKDTSGEEFTQYNFNALMPGEYSFLLLVLDKHPNYRLTTPFNATQVINERPTVENIEYLQPALGLTPQGIAELMGYTLPAWKLKEQGDKFGIKINSAEYNLLLLLAEKHPTMKITARLDGNQLVQIKDAR